MSLVKTKDGRARNFATVVYPDSASEDWKLFLSEAKIPVLISPLHDKDVNPVGDKKKPHYHVLFCFENKKNLAQVQELVDAIHGVGLEQVQSLRGYARYLCHLDNPEKAQYSVDDIVAYGGVDYITTIGLPIDKYKLLREMMRFCDDNMIHSFSVLAEYSAENRFDWFRILCDSGSIFMKEYLKSKTWTSYQESEGISHED